MKPVSISSLAMRFYECHGWTEEQLKPYLLQGALTHKDCGLKGYAYWILQPGARLDVKRLVEDGQVGELLGRERWGELFGKSDLEVLMDRNDT